MRKGIEIAINVLFWLASGWLITSSFSIQAHEIEYINEHEIIKTVYSGPLIQQLLICLALSVFLFYGNLWNLNKRTKVPTSLGRLLLSAMLLLLPVGLFHLCSHWILAPAEIKLPLSISTGVFVFYFTCSTSYGLGKMWGKAERQNQQLLLVKKQAELSLLRNQLQPHFLFNALNNLLSMVDQQRSPQLAGAVERLSQLLRYVIDETQMGKVTIEKEIQFLRNYGELQLMRFEEGEVDFQLSIQGAYDQQVVEPGLFIPFVENAFKYGTEPERQRVIEVIFNLEREEEIYFSVKNAICFPKENKPGTGTGIRATRERLDLIYPNKYLLRIQSKDNFEVDLRIKTT